MAEEKTSFFLYRGNLKKDKMGVIAGPYGLFGFGLATVLLNLANCDVYQLNSMNLAMGLALGFGLQGVGGIIALFQEQLLASFAFLGYAFFWLSYVLIFLLQPNEMPSPNELAVGLYLIMWLLFSICLTVCIWRPKSTWALRLTFITVDILFLLLALMEFIKYGGHGDASAVVKKIAGAEGIFCGFCALYTGMAELVNAVYKRNVVPLGEIETLSGTPRQVAASVVVGESNVVVADHAIPRTTSYYEIHEPHYVLRPRLISPPKQR